MKLDKQQEILAAALKLFVEHGFHGTPTSKIASEAGVANGTLFHYYKTKDDLIVALYISIKQKLGFCIEEFTKENETVKDAAKRTYTAALLWSLDNNTEFRFIQQFMNSPYLALITSEELQKQARATIELIERGIREKVVKVTPAAYANTIINSHLFGISQYLQMTALTPAQQKKLINYSFEMVWRMVT